MKDTFHKEGDSQEIEGLTVMIDGVIKQVFDKIRLEKKYNDNTEVLRDIIFEGINSIVQNLN